MLKPYDKPEDIPAELKDHYSRREDGKYHADIPDEHPAVKHNATLLSEKTAATTELAAAKAELESAKASGLPRGHVAVSAADKARLDAFNALNLKPEEIQAAVSDRDRYQGEAEGLKREKSLRALAHAEGANFDALLTLVEKDGLTPVLKEVDDKGKKVQRGFFVRKGDDGKDVETPYTEYRDAHWKVFESSLAAADPNAPAKPGAGGDPRPKGAPGDADADRSARAAQAGMYRTF